MNDECYIGIKSCGCVVCAIAKDTDCVEETLIDWKNRGLTFELITFEEARHRLNMCKCKQLGDKK